MRALATCCVLAYSAATGAAEMRSIEMTFEEGRYHLVSVAWFEAGIDAMYDVFSQWNYSTRFSSAIVEARDLDADAQGRPGFYVRNRGCVLFFCKSLVREGHVEAEHNLVVRAFADPARSDFKLSNETWSFREADGGTLVEYDLLMQPDFWVPPGIGPWMIKRTLKNHGVRALNRIEAIAQEVERGSDPVVD